MVIISALMSVNLCNYIESSYRNKLFYVFNNILKLCFDFLHRCMIVIGPKSFYVFNNVESKKYYTTKKF